MTPVRTTTTTTTTSTQYSINNNDDLIVESSASDEVQQQQHAGCCYFQDNCYEDNFNSWKYIDEASLYSIPEDSREDVSVSQAGTVCDYPPPPHQYYPGTAEAYPPYPAGERSSLAYPSSYAVHASAPPANGLACAYGDSPRRALSVHFASSTKPAATCDASTDQDGTLASEDSSFLLWVTATSKKQRKKGKTAARPTQRQYLVVCTAFLCSALIGLAIAVGITVSQDRRFSAESAVAADASPGNVSAPLPQPGNNQSASNNMISQTGGDLGPVVLNASQAGGVPSAASVNNYSTESGSTIVSPTMAPTPSLQLYDRVYTLVLQSLDSCTDYQQLRNESTIQNQMAMSIVNQILWQLGSRGITSSSTTASLPDDIGSTAEIRERFGLSMLYQATNGRNWYTQTNWLNYGDVCEWYGITNCLSRSSNNNNPGASSCAVVNVYLGTCVSVVLVLLLPARVWV